MANLPEMTAEEAQAVVLVWEKRGNHAPVPQEEVPAILAEIRARVEKIELNAARFAAGAWNEGRRFPRRQQRFALLLVLFIIGVVAVGYMLYQALTQ